MLDYTASSTAPITSKLVRFSEIWGLLHRVRRLPNSSYCQYIVVFWYQEFLSPDLERAQRPEIADSAPSLLHEEEREDRGLQNTKGRYTHYQFRSFKTGKSLTPNRPPAITQLFSHKGPSFIPPLPCHNILQGQVQGFPQLYFNSFYYFIQIIRYMFRSTTIFKRKYIHRKLNSDVWQSSSRN
jgi:hypothetical protein